VTAVTEFGILLKTNGLHMHRSDTENIVKLQFKKEIKLLINERPFLSPLTLFINTRRKLIAELQLNTEILSLLPSSDNMKTNIYRWKSEVAPFGRVIDRESFDGDFFEMANGSNIVLHAEFEDDVIVILGDSNFISRFSGAPGFSVVMDGTFKSSSTSFYQVYIIHGDFNGQSFPLIYCFLNGKTERLYEKTFNLIRETLEIRNVRFQPTKIQIDFEKAAFNAVGVYFKLLGSVVVFSISANIYGGVCKNLV
jgi:hypothetical protein